MQEHGLALAVMLLLGTRSGLLRGAHLNICGLGVQSVLHQLFHSRAEVQDDLSRADPVH